MRITWTQLKALITLKKLKVQYITRPKRYIVWAQENGHEYECKVSRATIPQADQIDFESNYKSTANQPVHPVDGDGKPYSRAESRPLSMTTYFTTYGDGATTIGDGASLIWDFNNTDNDVLIPPAGKKQKTFDISFIDDIRIKEGSVYWENMPFTSEISLHIMVPSNSYYKKNDGSIAQNLTVAPLIVNTFVNKSPMMGSCPMGDELNTEAASEVIPSGMLVRLDVVVPDSISNTGNSHGAVQLELYRTRTVILT